MTIGNGMWRRLAADRGRRLLVAGMAAMFGAGVSAVGFVLTPSLVAHASSVDCAWPAFYDESTGPQFEDGTVPNVNVYINNCAGGQPTGCQGCFNYDGNTWRQYHYQVVLNTSNGGGGSESDISVTPRAWACGTLTYNPGVVHWSTSNDRLSDWYDYGPEDNACGYQYDFNVVVTTWANERWSKYTSTQDAACVEQCPTG